MWKKIGAFFKSFWSNFRPGIEKFMKDELEDAAEFLYQIWINNGRPLNLQAIESLAKDLFHQRYAKNPGTWVTALLMLAWDALKNRGLIEGGDPSVS